MTTLGQLCEQVARWLTEAEPQDPGWSLETWKRFRTVCLVHGVGPLMYERLGEAAWLEAGIRDWLAGQYRLNEARLVKMQAELGAVLALFRAQGPAVMPLKGSLLAALVYPQAALRPMADLDLLIQSGDFEQSALLLRQLGYEETVTHWKHTEFLKPDNRAVVDRTGEHPDNPRGIELHSYCRETFGGPTLDLTERMWRETTTGPLLGTEAQWPALAALWLHLLVHASYHFWQGKGRLIHLVDLWLLSPHISEPERILQGVDARYTYPALALCRRYFPQTLAEAILTGQGRRLSPGFRQWAEGLDLVNASYLHPKPQGLYFLKALRFAGGRPAEVWQAFRFSFLPDLRELALDHPRLARSNVPWLAYFLLPLDWTKRLVKRR